MKSPTLLFVLLWLIASHAWSQSSPYCIQGKFSNVEYYSGNAIIANSNITYGAGLNASGNLDSLKLDLFYPNQLLDPLVKRPLVVFIPGNNFETANASDWALQALSMAKKGYVAASVNYRSGWNTGSGNCDGNITQWHFAAYRAWQDVHAAVRFLVHHATQFGIDTQYIFLAGKDVGAITALHVAYGNQQFAQQMHPGVAGDLGKIDSATNALTDPFSIKGIFSWCGSVLDTNIFRTGKQIPVLWMHGINDPIMKIDIGHLHQCNNYPLLYGPQTNYVVLKNLGICTEANYDAAGTHCYFPSLEEQFYMPEKYSCFFKKILCGNCPTQTYTGYNTAACSSEAPLQVNTPNPINSIHVWSDQDAIYIDGQNQLITQMDIIDATGNILQINATPNVTHKLSTRHLATGIYLFTVHTPHAFVTHKFMVQ